MAAPSLRCGTWHLHSSVAVLGIVYLEVQHANSLWHVESRSLIRDQTQAPCIGGWSLSYWITREDPRENLVKGFIIETSLLLFLCCCSVAKLCPTLCSPVDCNTPGFPVLHCLPEFAQTHIHGVNDAIQPSHPLLSPSPPAFNLSQHQGLFQWVSPSHQVAERLELQLQHQSFQWIFRTDFLWDELVGSPCSPRDSQESSPAPQFESIKLLQVGTWPPSFLPVPPSSPLGQNLFWYLSYPPEQTSQTSWHWWY